MQWEELLQKQKDYVRNGHTQSYAFRMKQLKRLQDAIQIYEKEICDALQADLGKHCFESYATEIGFVLAELRYTMKHLKQWMKTKKIPTPFYAMPMRSYLSYQPYGSVLIVAPYNYPFQLLMVPLIGAIAAGNCAIVSPSEATAHCNHVLRKLLSSIYEEHYVFCSDGALVTNQILFSLPFDYIFFTGSERVGKIVMEHAAKHVTPFTLELGGKSPVIVGESSKLSLACERIAWGKLLNCGQTCVAPDYVLVPKQKKVEFIQEYEKAVLRLYGTNIKENKDYGRVVNDKHMRRIQRILQEDAECIVYGGTYQMKERFVAPTLIEVRKENMACMKEELFAPILPIITYESIAEAKTRIERHADPLALYIFSEDKKEIAYWLKHTYSGGACINDTISHIINPYLPFGGRKTSGIGRYHGRYSFETFSHQRSIAQKSTRFSIRLAYAPYQKKHLRMIKRLLK